MERNIERLFAAAVMPFRILFSLIVFVGATAELEVVWLFSDIFNGLMALPNLIGLLVLSGLIARETKFYLQRSKLADKNRSRRSGRQAGWAEWKSGDVIGSSRNMVPNRRYY